MPKKQILVTGGAGYIGSHTAVELLAADYDVVILDNLSNSSAKVMERLQQITGQKLPLIELDLLNKTGLRQVFQDHDFFGVINFAGLKAVGESVAKPISYYQNNVTGLLNVVELMQEFNVDNLIFSSSATVYGDPDNVPIIESAALRATNPYGRSKLIIEDMLRDISHANDRMKIALLRYFNPVGAHHSGLIGEDPNGIPNNLMPFISQVAVGRRESLSVFGGDYPTHDGTGVRDYIHVVDLADGHVKALDYLAQLDAGVATAINLGTGEGYSVLDMVAAFEKAATKPIPYQIVERRAGDIAECYADSNLARELLGWQAQRGIDDMCRDTWNWQVKNPEGYRR